MLVLIVSKCENTNWYVRVFSLPKIFKKKFLGGDKLDQHLNVVIL